MAQPTQIVFSHREVVEALIRKQGIHEGIWGMYVRFQLKAANFGQTDMDVLPTAFISVLELGIQRFEKESNIAIDAAKINPSDLLSKPGSGRRGGPKSPRKAG
jgi:hypothetical protein